LRLDKLVYLFSKSEFGNILDWINFVCFALRFDWIGSNKCKSHTNSVTYLAIDCHVGAR